MVSTVGEFVDLVSKMRDTQRRYFRNRVSRDLNDSKSLEKQVDEAIEEYRKRRNEKIQPSLGI